MKLIDLSLPDHSMFQDFQKDKNLINVVRFLLIFMSFFIFREPVKIEAATQSPKESVPAEDELRQLLALKREAFEIRNDIDLGRLYRDDATIKRKARDHVSNYEKEEYLRYMFDTWNVGVKDYSINFKLLKCKNENDYAACQSLIREYIHFAEGDFIFSCSKHTDRIQKRAGVAQIFETFIDNDVNDCSRYFPPTPFD